MSLINNCHFFPDEVFYPSGDEDAFSPGDLDEIQADVPFELYDAPPSSPERVAMEFNPGKTGAVRPPANAASRQRLRLLHYRRCRLIRLAHQAKETGREFVQELRLLHQELNRCQSCPKENECPVIEHLVNQLETLVQDLYQEWLA